MRVLIAGCGYVGLALGAELARQGHAVFGLRRTPDTAGELQAAGLTALVGDLTRPETLERLPADYDWVVNCVSSSRGGADDYRRVYLEGTRHLLRWLSARPPQRLVYTSSTGVYGQNDGSVVEETSPTEPAPETARVLVETERLLLQAARETGFPAAILRLAGIYGPGRGYWLRQFVQGQAVIEGQGERILNMIHRDDVAGAIIAALSHGTAGEIWNVVDDEPVTQLAFFQWLAQRLDRPLPPYAPESPEMTRKRGVTNKRVSNHKLKAELGYRFRYPTFREGCAAELERLIPPGTKSG